MYNGNFSVSHCQATIEKSKRSRALKPSDLLELHTLQSWEALQALLQDPMSYQLAAIKLALKHYTTFMALFESRLGPTLYVNFIGGRSVSLCRSLITLVHWI